MPAATDPRAAFGAWTRASDVAQRLECGELAPAFGPPQAYDSASKLAISNASRNSADTMGALVWGKVGSKAISS